MRPTARWRGGPPRPARRRLARGDRNRRAPRRGHPPGHARTANFAEPWAEARIGGRRGCAPPPFFAAAAGVAPRGGRAAPPRTDRYALTITGRPEAAARASVTASIASATSSPRLVR